MASGTVGGSWEGRDWTMLGVLLLVAVTLRAAFFTGFFGSDELIYSEAAYRIVTGEWPVSNYIGALRYGVNLPVAMFMKLFGMNELAANLWSFVASVGEVGLVFFIGRMLWGVRAGFLAGLTLALLPLHVHFAGRLMADSPLAFFMTLSCALFLLGEATERPGWFFAAGIAAGATFWVKESPIVYLFIFALYALVCRRWNTYWLWMAGGAFAMLALNLLLMLWVTGNAWHVFKVNRAGVERFVEGGVKENSPWFYLRYLLLDVRHTWLLGFFAIAGVVVLVRERIRTGALAAGNAFVLIWAAGLIAVFSLLPLSLDPIKLIYKQTNYMLMFVAPLALLSSVALSRLQGGALVLAVASLVVGSVTLAGLEQQAIQVFTANSKAAVRFAETVPEATIYATDNNVNAEDYSNLMRGRGPGPVQFKELAELRDPGRSARAASKPEFVVVDLETIAWGNQGNPIKRIEDVPACWERRSQLRPIGLGWGRFVVKVLLGLAEVSPAALRDRALDKLATLAQPQPAYIYRIDPNCNP
jgi:4-amino-4-deoxy-L-arabinose transferase-like glycosyltransferase